MMSNSIDLTKLKDVLPYSWVFSHYANDKKNLAYYAPYVPEGIASDHMDQVVGIENWQREYESVNGVLVCRISIFVNGRWISRTNCGEGTKEGSIASHNKAEFTDAAKRAFQAWGIGRYCKKMGTVKVPIKQAGRSPRPYHVKKEKVLYNNDEANNYITEIFENKIIFRNDWDLSSNRSNYSQQPKPASQGQKELIDRLFKKYELEDSIFLHRFFASITDLDTDLANHFIQHLNGQQKLEIPDQFCTKKVVKMDVIDLVVAQIEQGNTYVFKQAVAAFELDQGQMLVLDSAIEKALEQEKDKVGKQSKLEV